MILLALLVAGSISPAAQASQTRSWGDRRVCRPAPAAANPAVWVRTCKSVREWAADGRRERLTSSYRGGTPGDADNRSGYGGDRTHIGVQSGAGPYRR